MNRETANSNEKQRGRMQSLDAGSAGLRNRLPNQEGQKPSKNSDFDFMGKNDDDCLPTPTPSVIKLLHKVDLDQRSSFNPFPSIREPKPKPHAWDGMPCRRYPDEIRPIHQSQGNPGGRPFTQVVDFVAKPVCKTPKKDWSKVRRRHSSEWELDAYGDKKERPDPLLDPNLKPSVRYYIKKMVQHYPRLNKEVGFSRWCAIHEKRPAFKDFIEKRCHHLLYDYRERFEIPKPSTLKNYHGLAPEMAPYVQRPYRHWPFVSRTIYPSLEKLVAEMNVDEG